MVMLMRLATGTVSDIVLFGEVKAEVSHSSRDCAELGLRAFRLYSVCLMLYSVCLRALGFGTGS